MADADFGYVGSKTRNDRPLRRKAVCGKRYRF